MGASDHIDLVPCILHASLQQEANVLPALIRNDDVTVQQHYCT